MPNRNRKQGSKGGKGGKHRRREHRGTDWRAPPLRQLTAVEEKHLSRDFDALGSSRPIAAGVLDPRLGSLVHVGPE